MNAEKLFVELAETVDALARHGETDIRARINLLRATRAIVDTHVNKLTEEWIERETIREIKKPA